MPSPLSWQKFCQLPAIVRLTYPTLNSPPSPHLYFVLCLVSAQPANTKLENLLFCDFVMMTHPRKSKFASRSTNWTMCDDFSHLRRHFEVQSWRLGIAQKQTDFRHALSATAGPAKLPGWCKRRRVGVLPTYPTWDYSWASLLKSTRNIFLHICNLLKT